MEGKHARGHSISISIVPHGKLRIQLTQASVFSDLARIASDWSTDSILRAVLGYLYLVVIYSTKRPDHVES
jgi:hypothetical protein